MRRTAFVVAALVIASLAAADVIDRVIAVVDGRLITLSDIRAATVLHLLEGDAPAAPVAEGADPIVEKIGRASCRERV